MGTRRERLLQKLNPNLLKMTPKLSGDAGSVIDLDSEDSLEDGAKKLMIRFFRNQDLCEKNKRNSAQHETEFTISTTKYNENDEICELITENLTLPIAKNDDVSERPGRSLQQLKMELQEKMSAKWLEEYNKRIGEKESQEKSSHKRKKKHSEKKVDEEDEEGKESSEELDYDDANDADVEYEDDEKEDDGSSIASDKEINENDCNEKADEKDDDYDDGGCSLVPAYQPGGGMLYGGSELTQNDEGLPQEILSPSLRFSLNDSFGYKASQCNNDETQTPKKLDIDQDEEADTLFMEKRKLFSQNPNDSFDLNDAFEFCSGKFPDAGEKGKAEEDDEDINEEEDEEKFQSAEEEESDDDEAEDVTSEKNTAKSRKNIIAFEDSEAEEEKDIEDQFKLDEDSQSANPKLLSDDEEDALEDKTELKKKNRKSLHFSDEEDATNDCEVQENDDDNPEDDGEDEPDNGDDCEQRSVHYDSEENEIINPKEFFEKEAELSGSEWSGDEDERGLDEFDVEEGDADNLDEDQVRSQLERIHVRQVLNDDAREVRLIQEILFEDGDLYTDGKVRERKFKWKNLGAFDDQGNETGTKDDGGNSSEDDGAEEEAMRKMRHEKELFLMEKTTKKNGEDLSSDEEIVENFHSVKVTSVKTSIKTSGAGEKRIENTKTDYTEIAKTTNLSNTRGSFLTRNEEFLSKLAKATSGVTDNVLGPKNSKNFVFTTKSPEKINPDKSTVGRAHEEMKRLGGSEPVLNEFSLNLALACKRQVEESCGRREKKVKLLQEIDTGPSILDLLV